MTVLAQGMIPLPVEISSQLANAKLLHHIAEIKGRIGLFGGSFDPIHRVHVEIARELLQAQIVDSVIFIPAAQNPLKSFKPTADRDRLAMILLALDGLEGAFVSDVEIQRGASSFTVDTLRAFAEKVSSGAKLFWIIGTDNLPQLPQWRSIEEIFSLASIITVQRDQVRSEAQWHEMIDGIPLSLKARTILKAHFIPRRPNTVSATAVRNKAAIATIDDLVTAPVAAYIKKYALYT